MSNISYLKSVLWNFRAPLIQFRYFRRWFGGTYYLVSDGFQQASRWIPDWENRKNKRVIYIEFHPTNILNSKPDFDIMQRERLWYHHGCEFSALYHDDGEMSCCNCHIDFKRNPLEDINQKLYRLHGNG